MVECGPATECAQFPAFPFSSITVVVGPKLRRSPLHRHNPDFAGSNQRDSTGPVYRGSPLIPRANPLRNRPETARNGEAAQNGWGPSLLKPSLMSRHSRHPLTDTIPELIKQRH